MAKTTFIDGNQSLGIQGTVVTAQFLNNLNNHRHDGQDEDGHGALDYAVTGGTGNAYTLALSPALAVYITGLPVYFRANRDNTGSATLNINGLGARTIRRVNVNLSAGQIKNGQLYMVMYDGTYFQLVSMPADNITLADAVAVPSANKVAKYNEQGILKGAELNMTGLASATSNTASTTLDLGAVTYGDVVHIEASVKISDGKPGGSGWMMINKDSTAYITFIHNWAGYSIGFVLDPYGGCALHTSVIGRVSGTGNLVLKTTAFGEGLSTPPVTYSQNQIFAFFLRKN